MLRNFGKHFWRLGHLVAAVVVREWPLLVLAWLALGLGGLGDLHRLGKVEFLTPAYALGLLHYIAEGAGMAALLAWLLSWAVAAARRVWLRRMAGLACVPVVVFHVFVRASYGSRLSPEIAAIIAETNRGEATEYLSTYLFSWQGLPWLALTAGLAAAFLWLDAAWHRRERSPGRVAGALTALLAVGALHGAWMMVSRWPVVDHLLRREVERCDNMGVDALTNVLLCREALRQTDEQVTVAVASMRGALGSATTEADTLSLVVVIGESYVKSHAQVYGYALPTTPNLDRERRAGRLTVFTDVISLYNNTNRALRSLMSAADTQAGEQWADRPLFPSIFKDAGFEVDMWDNQRDFMQGTIPTHGLNLLLYDPRVMQLCYSRVNERNFDYDGQLVEDYRRHGSSASRRLVVLHLRGQHVRAERRYPGDSAHTVFTAADYDRREPFITPAKLEYIAHYDNATRYNDAVLQQIFELFAGDEAVVVYLSDHGDEVYDYRGTMGRLDDHRRPELMVRYQYEIPFVVWCSPRFMARRPDTVRRLRAAAALPGTSDLLPHMLLGLGRVSTPHYEKHLDMLSADYRCPRRTVDGGHDYDSLMRAAAP